MMHCDIAEQARTWLGTPFVHQGRAKGAGVDCIGLLIGCAREAGLGEYRFAAYGRLPDPKVLMKEVDQNLIRVRRDPQPGDALLFRIINEPMHFGIYVGDQCFIHAYLVAGKVIEDRLDEPWRRRLIGVFEFKERYGG